MKTGRPRVRALKWTDECLKEIVINSQSFSEVLRKLGSGSYSGTLHAHLKFRLAEAGISTTHFLGLRINKGKSSSHKRTPEDILKKRPLLFREKTHLLRRALIESGVKYVCYECGINKWREKPLVLQIDHIDSDWRNNESSNLRFLCLNCHSQTKTFGRHIRSSSS